VPITLDAATRSRVLDFVRPLSVGLDGVTNFGFVERRLKVAGHLAARCGLDVDPARLFLLAAFAGLGVGPDSRADLLLRTSGVPPDEVARLVRSLKRYATEPRSPEELVVRDAALLETVGAYGVTQLLVWGTKERMTLAEMADEVEARMAAASFSTDAGREMAADRIAFAREFAARLRDEVAEFEA